MGDFRTRLAGGPMRFLTLRYFNAVAKLGSIRKAADRLHVAPSAVSRQIAQLEHELDAILFERSKSGVRLTAAGEVLARQSHRIFRDLDRARAGIDDLRGLRRGDVSLWVIEGFVTGLLPNLLGRLPAPLPGRRLQGSNRVDRSDHRGFAGRRGRYRHHVQRLTARRNRNHRGISRTGFLSGRP